MNKVLADKALASGALSRPSVGDSGEGDQLALTGDLGIGTLVEAKRLLKSWPKPGATPTLDIAKLESLDSSGALFLCNLRDQGVGLIGVSAEHRTLLDLIWGLELAPLPQVAIVPRWRQFVVQLS